MSDTHMNPDPFRLVEEVGGDAGLLPSLQEWLDAGAPMREVGPTIVKVPPREVREAMRNKGVIDFGWWQERDGTKARVSWEPSTGRLFMFHAAGSLEEALLTLEDREVVDAVLAVARRLVPECPSEVDAVRLAVLRVGP